MRRVAIIPARGGSTRIPRKNVKDFRGKPIIVYSIEMAKKSGLFNRIIVSTDDQEIYDIAVSNGAMGYIRPKELAENEVGTQEVARDALIKTASFCDEACVIYATSPLLSKEYLCAGLKLLNSSRSLNYAYSTDSDGIDAGNFYWGKVNAFLERAPLENNSIMVPMSDDRVCDINTIQDWERAELMFDRLRGGAS